MASRQTFEKTGVSVAGTGDTTVHSVVVNTKAGVLTFEVGTETQALDNFDLQVQAHSNANWTDWVTTWAADTYPILHTSDDLTSLSAGSKGTAQVDVRGVYAIRFQASAGADSATVAVRGTFED